MISAVHPVAVLSAVFWTTWSFCRFVRLPIGDQIVLAYSMIGRVLALYEYEAPRDKSGGIRAGWVIWLATIICKSLIVMCFQ